MTYGHDSMAISERGDDELLKCELETDDQFRWAEREKGWRAEGEYMANVR